MSETKMGIMCPLCLKTAYAEDTGLDGLITHVDLAWLLAWRTSDDGPICAECGRTRDEQ